MSSDFINLKCIRKNSDVNKAVHKNYIAKAFWNLFHLFYGIRSIFKAELFLSLFHQLLSCVYFMYFLLQGTVSKSVPCLKLGQIQRFCYPFIFRYSNSRNYTEKVYTFPVRLTKRLLMTNVKISVARSPDF